jgi:hypothetical protein
MLEVGRSRPKGRDHKTEMLVYASLNIIVLEFGGVCQFSGGVDVFGVQFQPVEG